MGQYVPVQHQSSPISKDKRVKMLILLPYCYAICLTRHRYSVPRSILSPYCFFSHLSVFRGPVIDDAHSGLVVVTLLSSPFPVFRFGPMIL